MQHQRLIPLFPPLLVLAACNTDQPPTAPAERGDAVSSAVAGHKVVNSLADPGNGVCNATQCTLPRARASMWSTARRHSAATGSRTTPAAASACSMPRSRSTTRPWPATRPGTAAGSTASRAGSRSAAAPSRTTPPPVRAAGSSIRWTMSSAVRGLGRDHQQYGLGQHREPGRRHQQHAGAEQRQSHTYEQHGRPELGRGRGRRHLSAGTGRGGRGGARAEE